MISITVKGGELPESKDSDQTFICTFIKSETTIKYSVYLSANGEVMYVNEPFCNVEFVALTLT